MPKIRKNVYVTAAYDTVSLGTGRKEFNPKKPRPGLEEYIKEAGKAALEKAGGPANIDEAVIGNFMAARFNRQGHLAAFLPSIDPGLLYKPCTRVEGACCSGGLAVATAIRSVLAETADTVLTLGVEVQNTVKAIIGADYLALAGWYSGERKSGHAYFFPGKFSDRAGAYYERYGRETARKAMAQWYVNAVENARTCPVAQESHNADPDLMGTGMTEPNAKSFLPHISVFDCSKVSDGASSMVVCSEEGLKRMGIPKDRAVRLAGFGQAEGDITKPPADLTALDTTRAAVQQALQGAGIGPKDLGTVECHDCFTITGVLSVEAIGLADSGQGAGFVLEGKTRTDGVIPFNTTGGLVGHGHYTGGTGVRQVNTVLRQLTGQAEASQVKTVEQKPYGLTISMGGNDKTVVALVWTRA
jgi:acetyl-CoA C-acetyltransferase/acetyl-CoA acyltransferase